MPINLIETKADGNLIIIIKPYEKIDLCDLQVYFIKFEEYLDAESVFKCVFDLRELATTSLELIMSISAFMKKIRSKIKNKLLRSVILVESNIAKNFLNILFTFVEPVSPYFVTNKLTEINELLQLQTMNLSKE